MQWSVTRNVKLKVVGFSRSCTVPERLLVEFFEKQCKHIKQLHEDCMVGSGIAAAMQQIVQCYENLAVLNIHGTQEPQSTANALKKCPNLANVGIHCVVDAVGSTRSYFLGAYCPKVTCIMLSGQFHVDHLAAITGCFPHIDTLDVYGTQSVNTLVSIIVSYRNLRKLGLCGIPSLDDRQISLIAQGCPCIADITMQECALLTQASIASLCTHCRLEVVSLVGCNGLMSNAITIPRRSALTHLSIAKCTKNVRSGLIHTKAVHIAGESRHQQNRLIEPA